MQPARSAQIDGVRPVFVIGVCAGLAAAVGIFAAWAVAAKAVARWNVATLAVLIWTVALVSVAPSLLPGRTPAAPRLGVLEGSLIPASVVKHTPFVTMPVLALLAGLVLGWVARGRRKSTLAVALTGLAGPALLTVAYLIAGPAQGATGFDLSPYWAAMVASGAGVFGSVLAAIVRGAPAANPAETSGHSGDSPSGSSPEPATDHPPLPQRHAPSKSAIAAVAAAAAQRPHPLADLAGNTPANAAGSPFSSGTGTPFAQPAHSSGASFGQAAPAPGAPFGQAAPAPGAPFAQAAPAPGAPFAQAAPAPGAPFGQPAAEPRFSGQQAPSGGPAPSKRRGWRTRRAAPENPPADGPPPTPSFNGFAAAQPGPRTGIDTAEHPKIGTPARPEPLTPDAILPPDGNRRSPKDSEYVDWVNGLGKA
jgi:hypothetical protein